MNTHLLNYAHVDISRNSFNIYFTSSKREGRYRRIWSAKEYDGVHKIIDMHEGAEKKDRILDSSHHELDFFNVLQKNNINALKL